MHKQAPLVLVLAVLAVLVGKVHSAPLSIEVYESCGNFTDGDVALNDLEPQEACGCISDYGTEQEEFCYQLFDLTETGAILAKWTSACASMIHELTLQPDECMDDVLPKSTTGLHAFVYRPDRIDTPDGKEPEITLGMIIGFAIAAVALIMTSVFGVLSTRNYPAKPAAKTGSAAVPEVEKQDLAQTPPSYDDAMAS